ncbi:MAG TPA: ABC transporter ATP-binding protein [Vicinamibacterales bacterium]|nr:ABC transporter ATP-binding protein [Vicinamibacterales bacterium]
MIEITGLTKSYGRQRVLNALALAVAPGEIVLLVGANGCGKSTTLRLLAGLSAADAGRIMINGRDVDADRHAALAGLSFLPQSPRFHERLTVEQILTFYARLRGLPTDRIDRVAARWGLDEFRRVVTGRLSGGTRQRLGLAVFDLPEAPILVLDEPGLSLDPDWRRALQTHLHHEAARGRTILVATHLLGEWEGQTDRCLVLDGGIVQREVPSARLREAFPFSFPDAALASLG